MNKLIKLYLDGKICFCIDLVWVFEDVCNVVYCIVWMYFCILEYIFMGFVVYIGYCERNLK